VECKNILLPLIEENDRPTQVTRDLKGTVEGKNILRGIECLNLGKYQVYLRRLNMLEIVHLSFSKMTEGKLWI
jgi:hypothetical protein